jgi:hypothetical protein
MGNVSNVVDQHLTPRFYLRGFADPNEPAFIWQYYRGRLFHPGEPRRNRNPVKRSLKKAGVIPNYYPDIEDELRDFEEAGKPIIEKIRRATRGSSGPIITTAEKHAFVSYVGNLHKRVTAREARTKPMWDKSVAQFPWERLQLDLANLGRFADALKLDQLRELFEQAMPNPIRQKTIVMEYDRTAKKLREMTWRFLVADTSDAFVTSDNPVYLGPTSFFVPLASHVALLGQMSGPDDCTVFPIDAAGVQQCNGVTIGEAEEYVYSSEPNQSVVDAFNATPP